MPVGTITPVGLEAKPSPAGEDLGGRAAPPIASKAAGDPEDRKNIDDADAGDQAAATVFDRMEEPRRPARVASADPDDGLLTRLAHRFRIFRKKQRVPGDEEEVIKAKWSKLFPGSGIDSDLFSMVSSIDLDMRRISTRDGANVDDFASRIDVSKATDEAIEVMLAMVQAHDWEAVKLDGTDEFRRKAWIALQQAGIQTTGYEPTPKDTAEVSRLSREKARAREAPLIDLPGERVVEPAPEGAASKVDRTLEIPPPPSVQKPSAPAADATAAPEGTRSISFRTMPASPLVAPRGPEPKVPPAAGTSDIGLDETEAEGLRQVPAPDAEPDTASPGPASEDAGKARVPAYAGPALT